MSKADIELADIISSTAKVREVAGGKINEIRSVTASLRMLAFNALIEAQRVGAEGAGFGVVAGEVKDVSARVAGLAHSLESELVGEIAALEALAEAMAHATSAQRFVDLALNAIELIDRNLYERTCDVRWWATDGALVEAAASHERDICHYAGERLGVILDAYTVYTDLWLCDLDGHILANGRPNRFPVHGLSVADRSWFQAAKRLNSGDDYAVADIASEPLLNGGTTATYAATVRTGGLASGKTIGVLGIHFDWAPQAQAIVDGVRLSGDEATRTNVMLVDARGTVIASRRREALGSHITLDTKGQKGGSYRDQSGQLVAFHATPGYETYQGLGWYGVITQDG